MVVDHHVGAKKWTWVSVRTSVLKHWTISPGLCLAGRVERPGVTIVKYQLPQATGAVAHCE